MLKTVLHGHICTPLVRVRTLTHSLNNLFKTYIRIYSSLLKTYSYQGSPLLTFKTLYFCYFWDKLWIPYQGLTDPYDLIPLCFCLVLSRVRLCDPVDCSPPGSSVHGISQARILEWVAISFSRGSSWAQDGTHISCLAGRFFTTKPQGKPYEWIP